MGIVALRRPNLVTSFDPATLALTGWWRASYAGLPWVATASAGGSGSNGSIVTQGANNPAVGAAQNGYTPLDFNGTNSKAGNSVDENTYFTTTNMVMIALFKARSGIATTAARYNNPTIFGAAGASNGLVFSTSGVDAVAYAGGYKYVNVAASTGAYHIAMLRADGTNLGLTVDSGAESTVACGTLVAPGTTPVMGPGFGGAVLDGLVLEVILANTQAVATNYGNIKSYFNSRYALSL